MLPTGWLDPEGKIVECRFKHHHETAEKIIAERYASEELDIFDLPSDILLKHGWVNIDMPVKMGRQYRIFWEEGYHPTEAQKNFIRNYLDEEKAQFPLNFGSLCQLEQEGITKV